MNASDVQAAGRSARIRPGAAAGHPAIQQGHRGGRLLTPALLGVGLAPARPSHTLHAKGRRHDRTSRTLSVSVSGPCHYRAAPVPLRHRPAHAVGGHERAQTAALGRKIAHDDAQNHPPPVASARGQAACGASSPRSGGNSTSRPLPTCASNSSACSAPPPTGSSSTCPRLGTRTPAGLRSWWAADAAPGCSADGCGWPRHHPR